MNEVQIQLRTKRLSRKFLLKTALKTLHILGIENAELSILVTDDEGIRALNKKYRGKDRPTDVLSFPIGEKVGDKLILGDVVISEETALRQARELGHSLKEEVARLVVHGIIHLLGYDHEKGGEEEKVFRNLEERVHAQLRGS